MPTQKKALVGLFGFGCAYYALQEVWFSGVGFYKSSLTVLMVAGFFTFLSAVAGGLVAVLIAKSHRSIHALVMCILIVAEAIRFNRNRRNYRSTLV